MEMLEECLSTRVVVGLWTGGANGDFEVNWVIIGSLLYKRVHVPVVMHA